MTGYSVTVLKSCKVSEGHVSYGASLWELSSDQCLSWLEKKPPKSEIYVSFGSMADITAKQAEEIACGLIASNMHILLVAKDYRNKFPIEFINLVQERVLVVPWCIQLEVLAYQAVALLCDTLWLELNIGGIEPRGANGNNATVE